MAKKTAKSTREQMYREILERSGIRFEDCRVFGIMFPDAAKCRIFHFRIMANCLNYVLFDSIERNANVIVFKSMDDVEIINEAKKLDGIKVLPKIR